MRSPFAAGPVAKRRANLYRSIARYWSAGISPQWIGSQLERGARDPLTRAVASGLIAGESLSAALRGAGPRFVSPTHVCVIEAAERSGRISEVLDELAQSEESALALRRDVVARTAYPLLVLHMAVLAPHAAVLVTGKLLALLPSIAGLAAFDGLMIGLYRMLFGDARWPAIDQVVLRVPLLGAALVDGDLRRYLFTTHHLYEAGVGLPDAFRTAADGLARPVLRARVTSALAQIPPEKQPFAHLGLAFPSRPELAAVLDGGFQAGDLTGSLRQYEQAIAVSERDGMRRVTRVVGGLLFAAAVVLVVIVATRFYGGLFKGLPH